MTEAIYLDIDGTLRDEVQGIPDSAIWAINQCRQRQIKIVVCTGRNPGSIQDDVMALPTDGIISGGGCYIQYHDNYIWKKHFSMDIMKKVIRIASGRNLSLALEAEQKIYMDHNASAFYKEDFQHKIHSQSIRCPENIQLQHKITYEDNFNDFQNEAQEIHKICILGQQEAVNRAGEELSKETEMVQKKSWSHQWYLELLPKGCDKGTAVKQLNQVLGIPKRNTMSFGDGENDIPMMKATGTAIAVGCNNPSVEKYASSICESVLEDGIYKELVRRNLVKPYDLESNLVICQEENEKDFLERG